MTTRAASGLADLDPSKSFVNPAMWVRTDHQMVWEDAAPTPDSFDRTV